MNRVETDYLIVGAGAMGMAFADEVFTHRPGTRITIVDRRAHPGGHWNDAYPFVTLHQPAVSYGVNSAPLGRGGSDLSTRSEILSYFESVLRRLRASGNVKFLPMSEYRGEGRVVSLVDPGDGLELDVTTRTVDATYMNVEIPSTHPPRYAVDPGVPLVPPNALASLREPWSRYVVVGAGKTGIDALLFLLGSGVAPERLRWIVPNDSWLWNRDRVQPGELSSELLRHARAIVDAREPDEVFLRLEREGSLFRIDPDVLPTKWRCATVSPAELEALRRVEEVVRLGRVERIARDEIRLAGGSLPLGRRTLCIDCTANGLAARDPTPIFSPGRITLQSIFMCQQVFSAAAIGHLESLRLTDARRNELWKVVPHPEWTGDMPALLVDSMENLIRAAPHMGLWLRRSRLNAMSHEPLHRYLWTALHTMRALPRARGALDRMASPPSTAEPA